MDFLDCKSSGYNISTPCSVFVEKTWCTEKDNEDWRAWSCSPHINVAFRLVFCPLLWILSNFSEQLFLIPVDHMWNAVKLKKYAVFLDSWKVDIVKGSVAFCTHHEACHFQTHLVEPFIFLSYVLWKVTSYFQQDFFSSSLWDLQPLRKQTPKVVACRWQKHGFMQCNIPSSLIIVSPQRPLRSELFMKCQTKGIHFPVRCISLCHMLNDIIWGTDQHAISIHPQILKGYSLCN